MALGPVHDNRLCSPVRSVEARKEQGFSLLEVMVSLVILSLVSLATFQSITTLNALSDRANAVADRAIERALDYAAFDALIASAVPRWPDQSGTALQGDSRSVRFTGAVTEIRSETGSDTGTITRLRRAELRVEDGRLLLQTDNALQDLGLVGTGTQFSYLATDRIWRDEWPLDTTVPFGPAEASPNDDYRFSSPPQFPLAVRLSLPDGRVWISRPRQAPELPPTNLDAI